MARAVHRLTAKTVEGLTDADMGRHADGGGLYLSISKNGGRRWVFLYRRNGKLREMGLGSARKITLAKARNKAAAARAQLSDDTDPLGERKKSKKKSGLTFQQCGEQYVATHRAGWKNAKHAAQWPATLQTYAYPKIGEVPVSDVDEAAVMRCIQPIWETKNETAARLRGRIEQILDWARVSGYRTGENPARWRGHLDMLLPKRSAVAPRRHHPAMPFKDVQAFMRRLAKQEGIAARSLAFTILTAARTNETTGARWREIETSQAIWTVPAGRMKGGREHRVPLSKQARAILTEMRELGAEPGGLIFPGRANKPQSENAMLALLRRMDCADVTVHGFRSTFRDWAAETTSHPRDVIEMALAHAIESETEAAYRRGDMLEKRRTLMGDWARFCTGRRNG